MRRSCSRGEELNHPSALLRAGSGDSEDTEERYCIRSRPISAEKIDKQKVTAYNSFHEQFGAANSGR